MTIMTGKNALIKLIKAEGVKYVFGIPGATEILFMDALEKAHDIQYVLGLNEIVCAGMAEGYARASAKPGFLNLHTGPGMAAALPMLYNAKAGGVPLVITVGQQDTRLLQYEPHLSGDIVGMGRLYTKWCTEIMHSEDIPTTIQRAFKMAMQPPSGPVLISLPQNVLGQQFEFNYRPNTAVYTGLRPDQDTLDYAVSLLKSAKRPCLLIESGVARCEALEETVRFAELIGARVYQAWMSDVNFPVTHPQYLGDLDPAATQARTVLRDVDLLIGIGCALFAQGFYNPEPILPEGVKLIHIDDDPWEIGKNMPVDCGIQGNIKTALSELNKMLEKWTASGTDSSVKARIREISEEKATMAKKLETQIEQEKDNVPISISRLMKEINGIMSPDTVIVDDCWSASEMLRKVLNLTGPRQFFRSRQGGSIGWGLPGALGVKLGLPEQNVLAVSGDGSAAWSMQTLWTAARYRIPVTYVITNNAAYRQVKVVRKIVLGDYPLNEKHEGMELDEPIINFSTLAQSMGVKGERVRRPGELGEALNSALHSGEPMLIEVFVE